MKSDKFCKNFLFILLYIALFSCQFKKKEMRETPIQEIIQSEKIAINETKETSKDSIREGDIIFHTSTSSQSKAIQLATKSKYSHVGIIFKDDESNEFVVLEAVQPVKYTPLKQWIARGENEHFVLKRLKNADETLTDEGIRKMKQTGEGFLGTNYDLYFEWSDERIYCSELVWKIYKETLNIEVGKLEKLSSFDLKDEIVKSKMRERYGKNIPLEENVISPAAIFDSEKLVLVRL